MIERYWFLPKWRLSKKVVLCEKIYTIPFFVAQTVIIKNRIPLIIPGKYMSLIMLCEDFQSIGLTVSETIFSLALKTTFQVKLV